MYEAAIRYRQNVLKRWKTNPPANWTRAYLAKNIRCVRAQIRHLSSPAQGAKP